MKFQSYQSPLTLFCPPNWYWTHAHAQSANCAASYFLISLLHMITAQLWCKERHGIGVCAPFRTGNCLCRANVDAFIATDAQAMLHRLAGYERAVSKHGTQANAGTVVPVQEQSVFADAAKSA